MRSPLRPKDVWQIGQVRRLGWVEGVVVEGVVAGVGARRLVERVGDILVLGGVQKLSGVSVDDEVEVAVKEGVRDGKVGSKIDWVGMEAS